METWTSRLILIPTAAVAFVVALLAFGAAAYRQLEPFFERILFYGIRIAFLTGLAWLVSIPVSDAWSTLQFNVHTRVRTWRGYPLSSAEREYEWHEHESERLMRACRFRAAEFHRRLAEKAKIDVERERAEARMRSDNLLRETRAMIASREHQGQSSS